MCEADEEKDGYQGHCHWDAKFYMLQFFYSQRPKISEGSEKQNISY
jgi:hypothetical protein